VPGKKFRFAPQNGNAKKFFKARIPARVSTARKSRCGWKEFPVDEAREFGAERKKLRCSHIGAPNITESPWHKHRHTTEIYRILSGSGKIFLGGKPQRAELGDLFVIHPGTAHSLVANNKKTGANIPITFEPSIAPLGSKYRDEVKTWRD